MTPILVTPRTAGTAGTALAALLAGCAVQPSASPPADPWLAVAEGFIDAFYSFDAQRLRSAMPDASGSMPRVLFYQGWAQGGHYIVLDRKPCRLEKADEVSCAITVKDDLIGALGTGYDVTDTFHLTFANGRIVKVRNSSNDPPQFDEALDWLREQQPAIFTGPCRDAFDGGPTPGDCVRAIVKGFADFARR